MFHHIPDIIIGLLVAWHWTRIITKRETVAQHNNSLKSLQFLPKLLCCLSSNYNFKVKCLITCLLLYWPKIHSFSSIKIITIRYKKNLPALRAHSHRALRSQVSARLGRAIRSSRFALRITRLSRCALRSFWTSRFALGLVLFAYI